MRANDEGRVRPTSFHRIVTSGEIEVIAPARLAGYADDGKSVVIDNGHLIATNCVLLGTDYQSSWANIFKRLDSSSFHISMLISSHLSFFSENGARNRNR